MQVIYHLRKLKFAALSWFYFY